MWGDISKDPKGFSPTFLNAALKDPAGANLDEYRCCRRYYVVQYYWRSRANHGVEGSRF